MGGGRWFYFPTHIWTPSGGWFPNPKNWRANTLLVLGGIGVAAFSTFSLSASLERRPIAPAWHIPSQSWCKHAAEDDKSL
ncbi:hypothetical protein NSK_000214 [Nannochloropsis salina CCMP1776]|uniref:Uncharacterized protein n=1 Tax=Nannochloropsis salina CCMP1776 TaxID=1027361 RepID=A0A4D9DFY8_9STRA|nr:hypothetical protein NSK_000214 [Nannochloropsis salina CCMP1776]|eukprot:TFJ88645.1 hypothetical protein NSK_000214 [Nannochloropsis salina CCMP1776]